MAVELPGDLGGLTVLPGRIDLQVNGAYGHDLTADPATVWAVGERLPATGVTAFLPTLVSPAPDVVARAIEVLAAGPPDGWRGAVPLGWHVEGPFLDPAHRGTHPADAIRDVDLDLLETWAASGHVRLVTLAPERPGGLEAVALLAGRGVVVSAGHSGATYEQAMAAFDAGATFATHLFNAMPPLHHRDPGLPGAALDRPDVTVGLIADGLHLHPATLRLVHRAAGPDRIALVTDAMAAAGMPDGAYVLGPVRVLVRGGVARLAGTEGAPDGGPEDGTPFDQRPIAGGTAHLLDVVRATVAAGVGLVDAVAAAGATPAAVLGRADVGALAAGRRADVVETDADLRPLRVLRAGAWVAA